MMRKTRKLTSILVLIAMLCLIAVPAMATGTETGTGSITINNAVEGQTYTIYQIFDLESFDSAAGRYSYKIDANSSWWAFVNKEEIEAFISVDKNNAVTWVGEGENTVEKFAEKAKAYIDTNGISGDASNVAGGTTVVFDKLPLGYYLVTSSTKDGALCSLDTTNPNAEIIEKNAGTSLSKIIVDEDGNVLGATSSASIGDRVYFRLTVNVQPNSGGGYGTTYYVYDIMGKALDELDITNITNNNIVVKWKKASDDSLRELTNATGGTSANTPYFKIERDDRIIGSKIEEEDARELYDKGYKFTIEFDNNALPAANDEIIITYSTTLNENVLTISGSSKNMACFDEGKWSETETYTYQFDLVKTDEDKTVLNGATFELYDAENGDNKILLIKDSTSYRVATNTEAAVDVFQSAVIEAGIATIKGLGNGIYWLEETKAPDGYNKLNGRVKVEIKDENLTAISAEDGSKWNDGGVRVINKTGNELPSTGGIGTTIFYVVGGVLVVGAGVLLVTRKRMNAEK